MSDVKIIVIKRVEQDSCFSGIENSFRNVILQGSPVLCLHTAGVSGRRGSVWGLETDGLMNSLLAFGGLGTGIN